MLEVNASGLATQRFLRGVPVRQLLDVVPQPFSLGGGTTSLPTGT